MEAFELRLAGLRLVTSPFFRAQREAAQIAPALLAPQGLFLATVAGQLGMSGILFLGIIPRDRLPGVVQVVRALVPSTYATDVLASSFARRLDSGLVLRDLTVCAVVAVASLALASWAFGRAIRA